MNKQDPLKELHKIREKNYLATKNMSRKQLVAYIQKKARKVEAVLKLNHSKKKSA